MNVIAGCSCCNKEYLGMGEAVSAGFGSAGYSQDGITLWQEGEVWNGKEYPLVSDVEALARKEGLSNWRIFFYGPLYETEYLRMGINRWMLMNRKEGFA